MLVQLSSLVSKNQRYFGVRMFAEAAQTAQSEISSQGAQHIVDENSKAFHDQQIQQKQAETLKPSFEQLENEIKELKNQNLYLIADVENARRRFERLSQELENTAVMTMAKRLLPVADNLKRIQESGDKQTVNSVLEAVGIVDSELHSIFKVFKIERLNSQGIKFDPEFHDAIATIPGKDENSGNVIDVITEGYTLAGKLLRAAKVVVGK